MKLLWASNYSSQSGYALQSRLFVPRIKQSGHDVVVFELSNGSRLPSLRDNIKILPTGLDPLGGDMMHAHYERENAHAVITLIDAWGMNTGVMENLNWFPYAPVDTYPVAPAVAHAVSHAKAVIAMSRYGEKQFKSIGMDTVYMPHAIDPTIWKPGDKQRARNTAKVSPNTFMVSFVGVNDSVPSRKGIPELLMAWQIFSAAHPDSLLYMHTTKRGRLALGNTSGVDISQLIKQFEIDPATVKFADEYQLATGIPSSVMATIAQAADVLILPTRGEGFGLPVLEYAAVGTPAIVTNFAASPELCFDGWLLEYEPEWSWQNALVAKPGIASIVEQLEAAYADKDNPRRAQNCIAGARAYHIDHVFATYTKPALDRIAEYVLDNVKVGA
jgi:glycosyltransferase involved in cell wall biosynthesis